MKKILFVNPGHFLSLTDIYFYYINLKNVYDITYIGLDEDVITPQYDDIKIIHLKIKGNALLKKAILINETYKLIKNDDYNYVHINYFLGCSFINMYKRNYFNIDIRTGIISKNKLKNILLNKILCFEAGFFNHFSCISESLKKHLKLPKDTHILPLGAPHLPFVIKDFSVLKVLYVGTFHNRDIVKTIFGFSDFITKYNNRELVKYTIIGFGSDDEIKEIKDAIIHTRMQNHIFFKGTIRYPELTTYLEESNVGLSYIPIKKCFDNQPPTKTFEYLLSGMFVIATGTKENEKVIKNQNGLLIGDSIEDISKGFLYTFENRHLFNSEKIQADSQQYSWENIVKKNLYPYIENFNKSYIKNGK